MRELVGIQELDGEIEQGWMRELVWSKDGEIFEILIIPKPSLGSREVPQKIKSRAIVILLNRTLFLTEKYLGYFYQKICLD